MQIARLKSSMASILAFGHMYGMQSMHRRRQPRAIARTIVPMELTMTPEDMNITFESDPELYRAIRPVFTGREKAEAAPQPEAAQSVQQPGEFKPRLGWTWEI